MNKTILSMMVLAALAFTSCSSDDDDKAVNYAEKIAGTYSGYTNASAAYFSDMITEDETVKITSNADGTANVSFASSTWGDITINNATVTTDGSAYAITGSGTAEMTSHSTGASTTYDCTLTGTITSDAELAFTMPGVMGGTIVTFITGEAPANLVVAGSYSGYADAASAYFSGMYSDDQTVKVTANDDGTVDVTYSSDTWGDFTISSATVVRTATGFSLSGKGVAAMANHSGGTTDYDCTFAGTVSADKSDFSLAFTLPGVMGNTTVTVLPGSAPATDDVDAYKALINTYMNI